MRARIFQRSITILLVICMLFSMMPTEMMSGVLTDIFADTPANSGDIGSTSDVKEGWSQGGAMSTARPTIRVVLSRDKENYLDGTEEQRQQLYKTYSYKYPELNGDMKNTTLFFLPSKYADNFTLSNTRILTYQGNPALGLTKTNGTDYFNLLVKNTWRVNSTPANPFKKAVMDLYNNKTITSTQDLAKDLAWKNYLPTWSEAITMLSYLVYYNADESNLPFKTRVENLTNEGFIDGNPQNMSDAEKFETSVGYAGVLAALYVIADKQGAEGVKGSYATAITDLLNNNNLRDKPVALLFDTCLAYTNADTGTKNLAPSIDLLEYALATGTSYSITEAGAFNYLGPSTTRELVEEMARVSLDTYSYNQTKGYITNSNDNSTKVVYRLTDAIAANNWTDGAGGKNQKLYTALGLCIRVFQFADSTQANIWTTPGGAKWSTIGKPGYLDLYYLNDEGIRGFAIMSHAITNPTPTVSYRVNDQLTGQEMPPCETQVTIINAPSVTVNIGRNSSLIDALSGREDSPTIKVEGQVYRTDYLNEPKDDGEHLLVAKREMPEMSQNLTKEYSVEQFTALMQGQSIELLDKTLQGVTIEREKYVTKSYIYVYDVDLKITIDKAEYPFKSEDIVAYNGDAALNMALFNIPAYAETIEQPPDIVIPKPASPDTTEIVQPSKDEDLENNTQMLRRLEYASTYDDETGAAAFAEVKSNTPLNEEWEVMGGIPSSEEIYFSVGGSEYKVALIMQYWMNEHSRDRTYTVHFNGTTCEYNNDTKGKGDTWEGGKTATQPQSAGGVSPSVSTVEFDHLGGTVTVTWTGSERTSCTYQSSCPFTHDSCPVTQRADYKACKAAAEALVNGLNSGTQLTWTAASDGGVRNFNFKCDNASASITTDKKGSDGSAGSHGDSTVSCGKDCTKTIPHGNDKSGQACDKSFTVTVTIVMPPHAICGPCCGHELPDLWDTWRQGLVYDFAKIGQIRLYLLNEGAADGFTELTGTDKIFANVVSGNPTYFMNVAQATEQREEWLTVKGPDDLSGMLQGSGMTFNSYSLYNTTGNGNTVIAGDNRWEAQSSRAGRIRYVIDPSYTAPETSFTSEKDSNGNTVTHKIDVKKDIVASTQHDDVIFEAGTRSAHCDGMATTNNFGKLSANNVLDMETTGHNNKWADGCLYTNILDNSSTSFSTYFDTTSYGYSYEPKQLKENDENVSKYSEDYNHHIVRTAGVKKAEYSDKADELDTATPEWKIFNAARRTKIIAVVISDFLIMQTSGGDQSIFYFEKASEPAEAQEHFQKIKATPEEMFTENPLSIFNGTLDCNATGTVKAGLTNFEIVGGYNGRYDRPDSKYKPYSLVTKEFLKFYDEGWSKYTATYDPNGDYKKIVGGTYDPYGNSEVITIFDKDPAQTINRPERQATDQESSFKIYQDNLQILPTTANQLYQPDNGTVWYSQVFGFWSTDAGPLDKEANGRGVGPRSNVLIGYQQRAKYGTAWEEAWGTQIGVQLNTKYYMTEDGDDNSASVNGVVVYTPVSTEEALVLPQGNLNIEGKSISRDQRVNAWDYPDMNDIVNQLKVCTLDPATCEYRYLDCKYYHDTVLADFDFEPTYVGTEEDLTGNYEHNLKPVDNKANTYQNDAGRWVTTNKVNGIEYVLPTGYTVTSGTAFGKTSSGKYLVATGTTSWSIPFSDLGLSVSNTSRVKVSMDIKVNGSQNVMVSGFKDVGFVINTSGIGSFITPNYDTEDEKGQADLGSYKNFKNQMKDVHLDIIFGFNNIVDCEAYVNGIKADVDTIKEYRLDWDETEVDGVKVREKKYKYVEMTDELLAKAPPANFGQDDFMTTLNIGTWSSTESTYHANYYIDNLKVILMGGTTDHTSACYEVETIHQTSMIHVCDADCYLKEDLYICDGLPNDDYQLGCGEEEGLPKLVSTTSMDFGYDGTYRKVILSPGTYLLETWGAQGGNNPSGRAGGQGGYSKGTLTVTSTQTVYIQVGSQGKECTSSGSINPIGGYNGGGYGYQHSGCNGGSAGGGATSIAYSNGLLSTFSSNYTSQVLLVAGGGGGAGYSGAGGAGGGGNNNGTAGSSGGAAGTTSSGYSFGQGQGGSVGGSDGTGSRHSGAGGGGLYGGYSATNNYGGGGGSGYGNTSKLTGVTGQNGVQTGDGLARITVVGTGKITAEQVATPKEFSYTGKIETVTLDPGVYLLEAWGAQGATNGDASTGKGGYSYGELTLNTRTTLYIGVGGSGINHNGWNGGGVVATYGGGATHIATADGELSSLSGNKSSIIIVAGGGGGGYCSNYGAAGGGGNNAGSDASYVNGDYGRGGSATYNAYFGQSSYGYRHGGGGGGGYYAGYGGYNCSGGGGGGSGYLRSDLANAGGTNGSRTGDGYVKITPQGHKHIGTPGQSYPYGCYTVPTKHTHNLNVLGCGLPEGGDGQVYNFDYTGDIQSINLAAGKYKLEVWGAQGGGHSYSTGQNTSYGGYGGYSSGTINLTNPTTLYVVVGGTGGYTESGTYTSYHEGYNGGGTVTGGDGSNDGLAGGGGATHIATRTGLLSTLSNNRDSVLIVAGGGGGTEHEGTGSSTPVLGGSGGGLEGGIAVQEVCNSTPATQNSGYAFGQGQGVSGSHMGSGGGGWYGGYGGTSSNTIGNGGSGYIGGVLDGVTENGKRGNNDIVGLDGYARITNLDHHHTSACYTTQMTCEKIPAGEHVCTGKLNTPTDYNTHKHVYECMTDYVELEPKTIMYKDDAVQKYVVPYTDFYKVEVYGPGKNSRGGYASAVVKLTRGDSFYVYVGSTAGYNDYSTDIRFTEKPVPVSNPTAADELMYAEQVEFSNNSRLLYAGPSLDTTGVTNTADFPLTDVTTKMMGNSTNGRVIFTPLNILPVRNGEKTILDQILDGDIPEERAEKYLGEALANIIINKAQVFKTWSGFSWTKHQGFVKDSNSLTFANNQIISNIQVGGWEFHVPVSIEAKSLRQVRITLDNNTNSNTIGVGINGGLKEVTTSMQPNTKNQEITITVSDKWWDDNITSLYFDTYPGTPPANAGTIAITKIELIGHADVTTADSGYNYSNLKTISTFSTADTKGFKSLANATISYSGNNMVVTSTGSNPRTQWGTLESMDATAVKAIKLVFTNKSTTATSGKLYYNTTGANSWTETDVFNWYVGGSSYNKQTVWIDTENHTAYNETTKTFTKLGSGWSGTIKGMRFDWSELTSGAVEVESITFIGKGTATGDGSYKYTEQKVHSGGTPLNYGYTGGSQNVTLYPGTYVLEAWGASGYGGAKGGYSKGTYTITSAQTLYIGVGQTGQSLASAYNGGGYGRDGGGGATHIALSSQSSGGTQAPGTIREGSFSASTPYCWRQDNTGCTYSGEYAYSSNASSYTNHCSGWVRVAQYDYGAAEGTLAALVNHKSDVLLVAGGGGGKGPAAGGIGGGANQNGGNGTAGCGAIGYGGTLDEGGSATSVATAGSFGQGGSGGHNGYTGNGYGGGGGGYYGGGGSRGDYPGWNDYDDSGAGGGSGYADTTKLTDISGASGTWTGNGKVVITPQGDTYKSVLTQSKVTITYTASTPTQLTAKYKNPFENKTTAIQTIKEKVDLIPDLVDGDYNPIFICKFEGLNAHECILYDDAGNVTHTCKVSRSLVCDEPHHKGVMYNPDGSMKLDDDGNPVAREHYPGSNRICWSACCNDDNHKNTKTEVTIDIGNNQTETLQLAEFLQIDEGFTIYFPNVGNFRGNDALGLANPQMDRGYGYKNNMDTTRWTREKRVKFPFDVIFEEEYDKDGDGKNDMYIYEANSWIELDVPTVFFNFYILVENAEMASAPVEFEVEAINCGTSVGVEVSPNISYSSTVSDTYTNALTKYLEEYLQHWYDDIKDGGYKRPLAKADGNNNVTGPLDFSETGYMDFYETQQTDEIKNLRDAMEKIDRAVEKEFDGDTSATLDIVDPHNGLFTGINEQAKPITANDNKIRVDNKLRMNSLQSLHGGYKKFYLDVLGRIGNFAITDTEDFRFSNFFKVPIISSGDAAGLADPNNWLVEGLVLHVDDGIQNLYVGDLYDIRGNEAKPNNRWLDTYGTQIWMSGRLKGDGTRDLNNPNLVGQILTGDVNNIEVLKQEELRYGYDVYTSIVTFGSYENAQVQVVPKYYALKVTDRNLENVPAEYNVARGTYVPIDVYIDKDGTYSPVNVFGNAGNGNPNKGNLKMTDYVFNLDWTNEANRRNYTLEEQARTLRVKEYFKRIVYDMSGVDVEADTIDVNLADLPILEIVEYITPEGKNNYIGTSQYILMDSKHRTFIGSANSYDNNKGGDALWSSRAGTTNFGVDKGAYANAYNKSKTRAIDEIMFEKAVQRWNGKLGIPSSSVFVPHGVDVNSETIGYIMGENEQDWVIVCTAEIIAIGSVWSIHYSQPWYDTMTINGVDFSTGAHYPGHRVEKDGKSIECPQCLPNIIAVFGKASVEDVEIIQIY